VCSARYRSLSRRGSSNLGEAALVAYRSSQRSQPRMRPLRAVPRPRVFAFNRYEPQQTNEGLAPPDQALAEVAIPVGGTAPARRYCAPARAGATPRALSPDGRQVSSLHRADSVRFELDQSGRCPCPERWAAGNAGATPSICAGRLCVRPATRACTRSNGLSQMSRTSTDACVRDRVEITHLRAPARGSRVACASMREVRRCRRVSTTCRDVEKWRLATPRTRRPEVTQDAERALGARVRCGCSFSSRAAVCRVERGSRPGFSHHAR
jgi:hypothetical protein